MYQNESGSRPRVRMSSSTTNTVWLNSYVYDVYVRDRASSSIIILSSTTVYCIYTVCSCTCIRRRPAPPLLSAPSEAAPPAPCHGPAHVYAPYIPARAPRRGPARPSRAARARSWARSWSSLTKTRESYDSQTKTWGVEPWQRIVAQGRKGGSALYTVDWTSKKIIAQLSATIKKSSVWLSFSSR